MYILMCLYWLVCTLVMYKTLSRHHSKYAGSPYGFRSKFAQILVSVLLGWLISPLMLIEDVIFRGNRD